MSGRYYEWRGGMETVEWNINCRTYIFWMCFNNLFSFFFCLFSFVGFFKNLVEIFFFLSCETQTPTNLCQYVPLFLGFSVGLEEVSSLLLTAKIFFSNYLFLITHFMGFSITVREWCSSDWRQYRKIKFEHNFRSLSSHFRTLFSLET